MANVGVLALQGAFREHAAMLAALGVTPQEVRQRKDLDNIDSLVIPGGESTTIGKLLVDLGILEPLKEMIKDGLPTFGTCAGLILLCRDIENSAQPRIGLLDATVRRNAFGRQVDSFESDLAIPQLGEKSFPAVFIRAPVIVEVGANVDVLAYVMQNDKSQAVAVRENNILATSFHPELTGDTRLHQYFLDMRSA